MIVVMYHYVRPFDSEFPFSKHLDVEEFREQLLYFSEKYGFVDKEDFLEAVKNGVNPKGVILTFDDGFKDHYTYVLPELRKFNTWGIFYAPTAVYEEKQMLLGVHRVHYLLAKYGGDIILKSALEFVRDDMLDETKMAEFDRDIYRFSQYEESDKAVRRLFNYYIKLEFKEVVLSQLMDKYLNEPELAKSVYMSLEELKAIEDSGSIVGSHTINHNVLSKLNYDEQMEEIKGSFDFLSRHLKMEHRSFCYPYGSASSYNQDTLKILKELDVNHAFIFDNKIENREVYPLFEISRIDCNHFQRVKL